MTMKYLIPIIVLISTAILVDLILGFHFRLKHKDNKKIGFMGITLNLIAMGFSLFLIIEGTAMYKLPDNIPKNAIQLTLKQKESNNTYIYQDHSGKEYNLILSKKIARDRIAIVTNKNVVTVYSIGKE